MIDTAAKTTFVASPIRMILLGCLGLAMTALSFAVAWPLFDNVLPLSFQQWVGWLGVILFSFVSALIFSRAFGSKRPRIVLTPQGFHANSVSSEVVPWRAVTTIRAWSFKGQRIIIAGVTEEIWNSPGTTRIARWTRSANQKLGAGGLAVATTGMPEPFEEIMGAFVAYAQRYGR